MLKILIDDFQECVIEDNAMINEEPTVFMLNTACTLKGLDRSSVAACFMNPTEQQSVPL